MTETQIEVIRALADNSMSVSKAAKALGKKVATIHVHINTIIQNTGKDPLRFCDLNELLKMAERQRNKKTVYTCTCKICGAKFEAPDHRYRLCSDGCRKVAKGKSEAKSSEAKAAYLREYRQQMKAIDAAYERPYIAPELSIAEVNELARANGMTYGKYVAQMRGK